MCSPPLPPQSAFLASCAPVSRVRASPQPQTRLGAARIHRFGAAAAAAAAVAAGRRCGTQPRCAARPAWREQRRGGQPGSTAAAGGAARQAERRRRPAGRLDECCAARRGAVCRQVCSGRGVCLWCTCACAGCYTAAPCVPCPHGRKARGASFAVVPWAGIGAGIGASAASRVLAAASALWPLRALGCHFGERALWTRGLRPHEPQSSCWRPRPRVHGHERFPVGRPPTRHLV